jgi:hypothetical protein
MIPNESIEKIKNELDYLLDKHGVFANVDEKTGFLIEAVWEVFDQAKS